MVFSPRIIKKIRTQKYIEIMKDYTFGNPSASNILVQLVDNHDLSVIESEVSLIREFAGSDFFLIAMKKP